MSPELSYGRHSGPAPHTARAAAVIVLLFRRGGRWFVPITKRPAELLRHGGQISLPGGRIEPGESAEEAAVRELVEELGLSSDVRLLGRLPTRYVFASDYIVTPLVGSTESEPAWEPDVREVERVVELPLETLFDPDAIQQLLIQRGPLAFRAPCFTYNLDRIWGATAVILAELADAIASASDHES
jgi:8-oxo-dGTP pyrophosphatase MutT (NUDIX family)